MNNEMDVIMNDDPLDTAKAEAITLECMKKARKYHTFTLAGNVFEVDVRYTNLKPVGGGSYGLVCSANDKMTGRQVAIKKVTDTFQDLIDAKRIMREIKLLMLLGDHENVIGITDIMVSPALYRDFKDVYIVCELMECDLDRIVSSSQPLTDAHAQYFCYQILRGLLYIHSANVLHRDLKPSNLLVNSNCDLSICDFGLARGVADDETLTEYVVTRWYRAPELLTEAQYYGPAVDVWSVGCILAELLGRKPLFQGNDYMHQLQVIIDVLGTPADENLAFVTNSMAKRAIRELPRREKRNFIEMFADSNPQAVDLLSRMLVFDPRERCTVQEALCHPYFKALHDANEEPECKVKFQIPVERQYRDGEIPKHVLQREIFNDMLSLHPGERGIHGDLNPPAAAGGYYVDSPAQRSRKK
jgi:serine/threonine protein kinase|eukprot:Stramenopile-MAST_4_protein_4868